MVRTQRDDAESFGLLLQRNRGAMVHYLSRMVQNQAVAEELAQDVFVRVYRSRHSYAHSARFSTWLYRIATNVALNHIRDRRRYLRDVSLDFSDREQYRRETPDRAPSAEERMVQDVRSQQVRSAIQSLPAKQRAAVILHKYHELDYQQMSKVIGCSPAAVKALMFRAYETLRVRLRYLAVRY
jgi:RNA polymerase sigma-70 factor (ECF subfamily)